MENISFLLGAGFSFSAGYPIANTLNSKLLNITLNDYVFGSGGEIMSGVNKPNVHCYDLVPKRFLLELMRYYNENIKSFNYEEFYDFLIFTRTETDSKKEEFFRIFETGNDTDGYTLDSIILKAKRILNQFVLVLLKDKNGTHFYRGNVSYLGTFCPGFPEYGSFLSLLKRIGEENVVHVHTLNHDLFFEQFENCDWLSKLSDGFEELGSLYYGKTANEYCNLMVRLERYTGNYFGQYRFYKLHGSSNYYPFYTKNGVEFLYDNYLKSVPGIGVTELYKETENEEGKFEYQNCWINYHSDFLTGTTSKILRYNEPFYTSLVQKFKDNVGASKAIIVIGYGCADREINKILIEQYREGCKVIIIDPYPSSKTEELCIRVNARIISCGVDNIEVSQILSLIE